MKLALWQTYPRASVGAALDALTEAAKAAKTQNADLLVTPEMFLGGYNIGAEKIADHAKKSQDALGRLKAIARAHDIALVAGLALVGKPRPHNACVAIDKTGEEVARYHKTHLFGDVDRAQFTAGSTLSPVFDLNGWRVGLAICYDIEFPELARSVALDGADLIVTPTANMTPFDSVATRLVPARAQENTLYVAYCNYTGSEAPFAYNGLSCVSGPDGADLARAKGDEEIIYAHLDRDVLRQARKTQDYLSERRPELYGGTA